MNRAEINRYEMMKSVEKFFTENAALIANQPKLVEAHTKLRTMCDEIYTINTQQNVTTKGITAQKTENRIELVSVVIKVNDALKAHAAATSDVKLKAEANISASEINRLRDNDLAIRSQAIYTLAKPLATELAKWGVTESEIDALEINKVTVMQKTPAIRNVRAVTVQATANLKDKLSATSVHLKETIDPMMLPFKTINPTLYGEYRIARAIIHRTATQIQSPEQSKPVQ